MTMPVFMGIESSCDETACGVVSADGEALANIVASQVEEHKRFGGVVPEIASRAHAEAMIPIIEEALTASGMKAEDIGAVAVTAGPGLIGPLLVGISAAQAFAAAWNIPIIPVNHLHAHLIGVAEESKAPMPFTGLVASGGHTALYRWVESASGPELLGTTVDDAAGEAFDKVAKLLGLEYPGGPAIEEAARSGNDKAVKLPRPGAKMEGLKMSFSGLKTAVLYHLQELKREPTKKDVADTAASFQRVVAEALAEKSKRALEETGDREFVVGGGVAANSTVRKAIERVCEKMGVHAVLPGRGLAGDNGVMVAHMGRFLYNKGEAISARVAGIAPFTKGKEKEYLGRRWMTHD
jgi:N6-L-threonylcarbamoyladenine synthase